MNSIRNMRGVFRGSGFKIFQFSWGLFRVYGFRAMFWFWCLGLSGSGFWGSGFEGRVFELRLWEWPFLILRSGGFRSSRIGGWVVNSLPIVRF